MKSKRIRGLIGSAIVLPLSLIALTSSPALAIVLKFCGNFLDGSGGVKESFIEVDADNGDFLGYADITTEVFGEERTYDETNFVAKTLATDALTGKASFKYIFNWNFPGTILHPFDFFNVFIPLDVFSESFAPPPDWPISVTNVECRDNVCRQDPDDLELVPTPGYFLGILSALGVGGLKAKKHLDKTEETAS